MVRLDSCKMKLTLDMVKEVDISKYDLESRINRQEEIKKHSFILQDEYKTIGLKYLEIKDLEGYCILEVSGKILRDKYYEGLNINTIEQVFDTINSLNFIKFDKSYLDKVEVLRCDVADNLKVKNKVDEYLNILSQCQNERYIVSFYNRKAGKSVVFDRMVKSYKERMTFYDKAKEILRDKQLLKVLSQSDIERFNNVLRCEQNITSFDRIRKSFKTSDNKLINILRSEEKVNYNTFNEIVSRIPQILFIPKFKYLKDEIKYFGMLTICQKCQFDERLLYKHIRSYERKNIYYSRWHREFINFLQSIKASRKDIYKKEVAVIEEIKELLKAA